MDCRVTLKVNETFLKILQACFEEKKKAYLILDEDGMVRTEGFIHFIDENKEDVSIVMDNQKKVELSKIIAVNGTFRPEYGEC